jgi:hypothetical protein
MNRKSIVVLVAAALVLSLAGVSPVAAQSILPLQVMNAVQAGILDEYNAYNLYQAVLGEFGSVRPLTNIQAAEAQHITAWQRIFSLYAIPLPPVPVLEQQPQFASLAVACEVAADAEIANVKLYDGMLKTVSAYPDMVRVVTALRSASQNRHLPAFQRCAG